MQAGSSVYTWNSYDAINAAGQQGRKQIELFLFYLININVPLSLLGLIVVDIGKNM